MRPLYAYAMHVTNDVESISGHALGFYHEQYDLTGMNTSLSYGTTSKQVSWNKIACHIVYIM